MLVAGSVERMPTGKADYNAVRARIEARAQALGWPALRERAEDIELLALHFLRRLSEKLNGGSQPPLRLTREATEALDRSKMLRAALGDGVVDHYVHTARWEQAEHDRKVTDWELMRGFERY